jgi:hypothetical protein
VVSCLVACHRVGCVHDHHLHRGVCHHPTPPGRPQGGIDPDRDGAVRRRPGVAPKLATTMSPLVLDGYPAVMRQTIRSEIFALLLPPAEASARGGVSRPPGPASSWPGPGPWSRQRDPKALNQQVIVGPGLECRRRVRAGQATPAYIDVVSFPLHASGTSLNWLDGPGLTRMPHALAWPDRTSWRSVSLMAQAQECHASLAVDPLARAWPDQPP